MADAMASGDDVLPLHPEPVPDDPGALRWVTPAGVLPFVGAVREVPVALDALLDDGTLAEVLVHPDAVLTRLGPDQTWRGVGARVRDALQAALAEPGGWLPETAGTADDVLTMATEQVLAGDVGDYIRGHGGRVSLVDVTDGRVEVNLGGACAHCPASDVTMVQRVETAIRARFPGVREVVARTDPGVANGRRLLGVLPTRRG